MLQCHNFDFVYSNTNPKHKVKTLDIGDTGSSRSTHQGSKHLG